MDNPSEIGAVDIAALFDAAGHASCDGSSADLFGAGDPTGYRRRLPMVTVKTTYLEQTDPDELRPARPPADIDVVRAEVPSPEFSRFLYTAIGGDWHWLDRLGWTYDQWQAHLGRPGAETWVAWQRGTPAGYVELDPQPDATVEIAYFGLIPAFIGRGIGGHLLTVGTARAWDLATRWPGRQPTRRVWVHTCTLDGPHALANYEARGFRQYKVTEQDEDVAQTPPGPWPGARGSA